MGKEDNGGPAFPLGNTPAEWMNGMSLRDYFAAKAMQANLQILTDFPDENWRMGLAIDSYAMADAMLEARKK